MGIGERKMRIGDWGLGIGDWGLGIGDWGVGVMDWGKRSSQNTKTQKLKTKNIDISFVLAIVLKVY